MHILPIKPFSIPHILINSIHYSAFLSALCYAFYVIVFLQKGERKWLYFLVIYDLLAVLSDRLFIVTFIAPTALTLSLFLFKKKKQAIAPLLITVLLVFLGIIGTNLIKVGYITIPQPHKFLAWDNVVSSFSILVEQLSDWVLKQNLKRVITLSFFLCSLLSGFIFLKSIRAFLLKKESPSEKNVFAIWLFFFMLIVFISPVLSGAYTGWDCVRYNFSAYMLGIIMLPFMFPLVFPRLHNSRNSFNITFITTVVIVLSTCITVFYIPKDGLVNFLNYYPKRVEQVDSIAEKLELKHGVAEYQDAKVITMFSKEKVRVYTVFDSQTPWFHVTNQNWFYKTIEDKHTPPVFNFTIVKNEKEKSSALKLFGAFLDSSKIEGNSLFPEDRMLYKTNEFIYPEGQYDPVLLQ